jgi:hypothetical protein
MAESPFKARVLQIAGGKASPARDFTEAGIPRVYLRRLRDEGQLVRTGRGLYQIPGVEFSTAHSLAEAVRILPRGVVCLLSALQHHGLTTQTPHEVKVVRASGEALTAGIERHTIERVITLRAMPGAPQKKPCREAGRPRLLRSIALRG